VFKQLQINNWNNGAYVAISSVYIFLLFVSETGRYQKPQATFSMECMTNNTERNVLLIQNHRGRNPSPYSSSEKITSVIQLKWNWTEQYVDEKQIKKNHNYHRIIFKKEYLSSGILERYDFFLKLNLIKSYAWSC
jgi:hypothetical protein